MEELDPESRDALRRYREAAILAPPARARVLRRLEASLDHADADPRPATPQRRRTTALVVLTALAAALTLVLCDLRERLGGAPRADENIAPYTAPSAPGERTRPRPPAAAPRLAPVVPAEPGPRRGPAPDLAAELAHLQRARAAIDTHDPDAALAQLAEHAHEFPDGQMREDRQLLRVEALCARGDADQARAEARAFLRQFPGSPHAGRVTSFCPEPVTDREPGGESPP